MLCPAVVYFLNAASNDYKQTELMISYNVHIAIYKLGTYCIKGYFRPLLCSPITLAKTFAPPQIRPYCV